MMLRYFDRDFERDSFSPTMDAPTFEEERDNALFQALPTTGPAALRRRENWQDICQDFDTCQRERAQTIFGFASEIC
jgi:hypothetical protein